MNKDCQYFENIFIEYANWKLEEKDNDFCDIHYKTCETCKSNEAFAELSLAWKAMDKWQDIQPSTNFIAKLQHEIVVLEEKRRIFWFKIDNFFSFARTPIMSLIFIAFTSTTNLSYANSSKSLDLKSKSLIVQENVKIVANMKISDVLNKFTKNHSTQHHKRLAN